MDGRYRLRGESPALELGLRDLELDRAVLFRRHRAHKGLVRLTLNYFLLFRDQGNQLIDIGAVHTLRLPEPANHVDYQEEHEKVLKHFHRAINDSSALLPKQRTPRSQDVAQGRVDIGGGQCLVTIDSVAIRVEAVRQEYFIALVVVRP